MRPCENIIRITLRLTLFLTLLPFFNALGSNGSAGSDTVRIIDLNNERIVSAYQDSIDAADRNRQNERKADLYLQLGKHYLRVSDYTESFTCFFKSLEIRQQINTYADKSLGYTYAMLGEAYRAITQFENSLEYLNKALKIYNEINDPDGAAYVRNRLASVYYEIAVNRNDTAMMMTAENETYNALNISKNRGSKELTVSNYNILGAIHNYIGNTREGREFLFLALKVSDSLQGYLDAPNIINNIANSYLIEKNFQEAIKYAEMSYRKADSSGIRIYKIMALRILTESYSGSGNYKKAYEYLLYFNNESGAVFNEKMESDVLALKKKNDIELDQLNKTADKNRNLIIITAIAVFLIFLGIGILLRMRGIQRINRDLEAQRDTIARQKDDLERINTMKDRYFSILSHDLRNPLSGIHGFSNMLDSGFDDYTETEKKEYIGYIKASSESMYRVIEKVLTWSRLQSHTIKVHLEDIDLSSEVNNIINLQRPNASRKGIVLENRIDSVFKVNSDKSIIDTVLTNLIDNSIKFTREGGRITVSAESVNGVAGVSVADTGIGMTEQKIRDILSRHEMLTTRGTNNEKGTGFGLSICTEMLELIGSELQIESKTGEGTKFFFVLNNRTDQLNLF